MKVISPESNSRALPKQGSGGTMVRGQRIRALDGLRAVAVTMVLFFHIDDDILPGGFIGVDVFFCLSGYVIARQLFKEITTTRTVELGTFWRRRFLRLFPPLIPVLVACAVAVAWFDPQHLRGFRSDALSSVTSTSNWWFIYGGRSYFETTGRPPILQHLWSLAVEEQFYVALPMMLVGVAYCSRGRSMFLARTALVAGAGALLSMAVMSVGSYAGGVPYRSDGSVWYFGTFSHCFGLLLGVVLAAAHAKHPDSRNGGVAATMVGFVGLGSIIVAAFTVTQGDPALYRWQLQLVSIGAVITIAAVVHSPVLSRGMGHPALVWIGLRSYAIYLWHWPVLVSTRPEDIPLDGTVLIVLQIGTVLALGELSYRFIEEPLRRRHTLTRPSRRHLAALSAVLVTAAAAGTAIAATTAPAALSNGVSEISVAPQSNSTIEADDRPNSLSAYGDSVLVGAWSGLAKRFPGLAGYAREGAQTDALFEHIEYDRNSGALGNIVYIQTGNNGFIDPRAFSSELAKLSDRKRVLLAVPKVDRAWEAGNVELIRTAAAKYPNVRLVDWRGEVERNPDLLYEDGLHMRPGSADALSDLIDKAIGRP
ncbi:acyltransferase family protein [Rhodococcus erythropolis]|nr:acyltransferase family protein [Rhodococcus erythropolis]